MVEGLLLGMIDKWEKFHKGPRAIQATNEVHRWLY